MSCSLTQGYTLGCRDSVGGIKTVRFAEFSTVTGVAVSSGNVVTGVTLSGSTKFWRYELPKQTSQFTETATGSSENGTVFYQQDLQIVLNKMDASLRNELRLLSRARLIAIVEDRNGNFWMLGRNNGLELTTGTSQTGTAMGDRNGYDMTYQAIEETPIFSVLSSIVSGITN